MPLKIARIYDLRVFLRVIIDAYHSFVLEQYNSLMYYCICLLRQLFLEDESFN